MISNQVFETFRSSFENFFADKGIKWCNDCFAGYKNGLFSYVELLEIPRKQNKNIDLIFRVQPEFYTTGRGSIHIGPNCLVVPGTCKGIGVGVTEGPVSYLFET